MADQKRNRTVFGRMEIDYPAGAVSVIGQQCDGIHVHTKKCQDERVIPFDALIDSDPGRRRFSALGAEWDSKFTTSGFLLKKAWQPWDRAKLITWQMLAEAAVGQFHLDFGAERATVTAVSPPEPSVELYPLSGQNPQAPYGKIEIGTSEQIPNPRLRDGWSLWIENRTWCVAPKIDPEHFGKHAYMDDMGDCPCGCIMNQTSSSGPVDPFGPCPLNPLEVTP
jgi:hypothetical protein